MKMILFFKSRTFWLNIILAIVFLLILILPLNAILKILTGHGEVEYVPDVRNTSLAQASIDLEKIGLFAEVLDSSAFFQSFKAGYVVQQYPKPGSAAKAGRKIKLTINRYRAESVYVPQLIERTSQRASFDLRSRGLILGEITYRPDLAEGIVLAAKVKGSDIMAGDLIRKGSVVDLIVGEISGPPTHSVPNIVYDKLIDAMRIIEMAGLRIQLINGDQSDLNVLIIKQDPATSDDLVLHSGGIVQVWLENNQEEIENK